MDIVTSRKRLQILSIVLASLGVLNVATAQAVRAVTITKAFSGTVNVIGPDGSFPGAPIGTPISGTFTYDDPGYSFDAAISVTSAVLNIGQTTFNSFNSSNSVTTIDAGGYTRDVVLGTGTETTLFYLFPINPRLLPSGATSYSNFSLFNSSLSGPITQFSRQDPGVPSAPTPPPQPKQPFIVNIAVSAYIPDAYIPSPFGGQFKGDNRGPSLDGSSRLYSNISVDLDSDNPIRSSVTNTYPTTGIAIDQLSEITGKAVPQATVTATRQGDSVVLHVEAEASNPLILGAPPIKYNYDILLSHDENSVNYVITGSNQAYPAYTIFVGNNLAYQSDPSPLGAAALYIPVTIPNTLGTILSTDAAARSPGSSQNFPLLPQNGNKSALDQSAQFITVPSGSWFDPPTTFGLGYTMTSNSLFTNILNFPVGLDADGLFTVSVGQNVLGQFSPGQSVDFTSFLGGGVPGFTITGIDALGSSTDPINFPLQLAFNTPTASFDVRSLQSPAVAVPEPEPSFLPGLMGLGIFALLRKKLAHVSKN